MYRATEGYYEPFDRYARGDKTVKEPVDEEYERTGKGIAASNGFDFGMKIRPTKEEISSMGPAFEKYWKRIGADKPDKPLYSNVILPYFYSYRPPPEGKYFCIGGFHNYPASRGSRIYLFVYGTTRNNVFCRRLPFYEGEEPDSHPRFDPKSPARLRTSDDPNRTDKPVEEDVIPYSAEDDRVIELYVRENVATAYHSIGTCAMRGRDAMGVVDARLNVHGVKNLKVAAENAARIILQDLDAMNGVRHVSAKL
ncbi:hypothetical protein I203_108613 [Kwoniella mangroviensis CBS 8507]|uniref:hypothetical protein n=1 Tax=Kwoniella mangroviensis CBS 8507 TaxID=1296122 RepID=UPI0030201E69